MFSFTFCYTQPYTRGLRKKLFPYFDDFIIIFGKDRATGEGAKTTVDAIEKNNDENEEFVTLLPSFHIQKYESKWDKSFSHPRRKSQPFLLFSRGSFRYL